MQPCVRHALLCGLTCLVWQAVTNAQSKGDTPSAAAPRFEHLYDIPFQGKGMPMTMIRDAADRPFLYVAAKEAGLLIYDVKDSPRLVRSIPIAELLSLHVMSLSQAGKRVYLALGDHWGKGQTAGLAVIDISKPAEARVVGVWKDTEADGAGGAVVVRGRIAYLAAMRNGLVLLDVGKPSAIRVAARLLAPSSLSRGGIPGTRNSRRCAGSPAQGIPMKSHFTSEAKRC